MWVLATTALLFILLVGRLIQAIRSTHARLITKKLDPTQTCALAVLLGSGGHTGEMIRLMAELPFDRYTPRTYLISSGDTLSRAKAIELERLKPTGQFEFLEIPRARRVHQSFLTTPFSTIFSFAWCLWFITFRSWNTPSLILLNGPGSSVPIALAAFIPRLISSSLSPRLIYVESLARVTRLSLSARILLPFIDDFVVQWNTLAEHVIQSNTYKILDRFGLVPVIVDQGWMV